MKHEITAADGTWQMIRAEFDGEGAPELVVGRTVLELARGGYEVHFDGVRADRGFFRIEAGDRWLTMNLQGLEGPNAGRSIPCILQFMGDLMRICYGLDGELPAEFKAVAGQGRYLATYRRMSGPIGLPREDPVPDPN